VTLTYVCFVMVSDPAILLGFERKARLFCDLIQSLSNHRHHFLLGFERKARLFCDLIRLLDQNIFYLL